MHKKLVTLVLSGMISLSVIGCGNSDIDELQNQVTKLEQENETLETTNTKLEKNNKALQEKVNQAKPWFEMKEEERKAEEEKLAKEKAEKEAAEKKAREEAEAKAKAEQEAKEKQGYETGITYNQLARTPDQYKGEKCKFKGEVIQVMEDESYISIRLAVNGGSNVLYVVIPSSILGNERILEDDYITVYGTSTGVITYTTVMGNELTIPSMLATKLDR
ncbi:bZIP transcription factor [Romboutsia ilealis]|uniref:bZIP transcription factor n=1 Tax=Romboutsia ilealis TaxID=1115758 RepID=UPI0023F3B94C|nr:bZIP transcription factor [Romboutsia ilealis]